MHCHSAPAVSSMNAPSPFSSVLPGSMTHLDAGRAFIVTPPLDCKHHEVFCSYDFSRENLRGLGYYVHFITWWIEVC